MKPNKLEIYTITSLYISAEFHRGKGKGWKINWKEWRSSKVGFYPTLKKSQICVENNWGGLDECGYYNYIVIQREVEGLYNLAGMVLDDPDEWWYKWSDKKRTWVPCERPKQVKGLINFG